MLCAEALTMTGSGGDTGALEVSQVSQGAMATKFDIAAVVGMKEKHKQQPLIMLPRLLPQCRVGWRSGRVGVVGGVVNLIILCTRSAEIEVCFFFFDHAPPVCIIYL